MRNGEISSLAEHVDASRIGLEMSGRAVEPGLNGGKGGTVGDDAPFGIGGALRIGTVSAFSTIFETG